MSSLWFRSSLTDDEVIGIIAPTFLVALALLIVGGSLFCSLRREWRRRVSLRDEVAENGETTPLLPRWNHHSWSSRFSSSSHIYDAPLSITVPSLSKTGAEDDSDISPCTTPPARSPLSAEEFRVSNQGIPPTKVAPVAGTTKKLVTAKRKQRQRRGMLAGHLRVVSESRAEIEEPEPEGSYITMESEQAKRDSGFIGNFSGPDELMLYLRQQQKSIADQETATGGRSI